MIALVRISNNRCMLQRRIRDLTSHPLQSSTLREQAATKINAAHYKCMHFSVAVDSPRRHLLTQRSCRIRLLGLSIRQVASRSFNDSHNGSSLISGLEGDILAWIESFPTSNK